MSQPTVLVTCATGKVGFATCRALNGRFSLFVRTRAGIRNPAKAEKLATLESVQTCKFDAEDAGSLQESLRGVDRLFLIPPTAENRVEICQFVIDCAKAQGVNFVCLLSMVVANTHKLMFGNHFGKIEDHLKASGLRFCILRSNLHMENLLAHREHLRQKHEFITALHEDARVSYVAVDDVGLAAATVLANPIGHEGKTYTLTGPEAVTQRELCDRLGSAVDCELTLRQISFRERRAFLTKQVLMPEWQVKGWEEVLKCAEKDSALNQVCQDCETITGVRCTPFHQWLAAHLHLFRDESLPTNDFVPETALDVQPGEEHSEGAGLRAAVNAYGGRADEYTEFPASGELDREYAGSKRQPLLSGLTGSRYTAASPGALPLTGQSAAADADQAVQAATGMFPLRRTDFFSSSGERAAFERDWSDASVEGQHGLPLTGSQAAPNDEAAMRAVGELSSQRGGEGDFGAKAAPRSAVDAVRQRSAAGP